MNSASFYCIRKQSPPSGRGELPSQIYNHLLCPEDHEALGTAFVVSPYTACEEPNKGLCFYLARGSWPVSKNKVEEPESLHFNFCF